MKYFSEKPSNFEKNMSEMITPVSKDFCPPVNEVEESNDQMNLFSLFTKKSPEIEPSFQFNFENEPNYESDNRSFALNLSCQTADASFNFSSMFENPQKLDKDKTDNNTSLFSSMFGAN